MEEKITYLILHENGVQRKITVPSSWKVTFGPAARGMDKGERNGMKIPMALRFYENETKQRAIFTDVVSFRDLSIEIQELKVSSQEKHGFMEFDGVKKATTMYAETKEWVNPDELHEEVKKLPTPKEVMEFDVAKIEEIE